MKKRIKISMYFVLFVLFISPFIKNVNANTYKKGEIIVTLTNEASLNFKELSCDDFPNLKINSLECLNPDFEYVAKQKLLGDGLHFDNEKQQRFFDNFNLAAYKKIYLLELEIEDDDYLKYAIKYLSSFKFVDSAAHNWYMTTHSYKAKGDENNSQNIVLETKNNYDKGHIILTLNNSSSLKFISLEKNDFPDLKIKNIKCLNPDFEYVAKRMYDKDFFKFENEKQQRFFDNFNLAAYKKIYLIELEIEDDDYLKFALKYLSSYEFVDSVSRDWCLTLSSSEFNDPILPSNNAYDFMNFYEGIEEFNSLTNLSMTTIAVVDTGINSNHEDLQLNGSTIVDIDNSYDFINDVGYSIQVSDNEGHGTMIAGIIAATQNNNVGTIGITNKVKLISYRVNENNTELLISHLSSVINKALNYNLLNNDTIDLFNMSFGIFQDDIPESDFNSLKSLFGSYYGLFICSAGNYLQDLDTNPMYPACFDLPNVICVGTIDELANRWIVEYPEGFYANNPGGSAYGSRVDIYALGVNVYTLWKTNDGYTTGTGTSFAAPYVVGALSMLISQGLDIYQAKETLLQNTRMRHGLRILNFYSWENGVHYHSISNVSVSDSNHCSLCSSCDYYIEEPHNITTTYASNSHTKFCSICGYTNTDSHIIRYTNLGVDSGHKVWCQECSYFYTEAHVFSQFGLMYKCTKCNCRSNIIPIIHD